MREREIEGERKRWGGREGERRAGTFVSSSILGIHDYSLDKRIKETVESTVHSDSPADNVTTLQLAFVCLVIVTESIEQVRCVLELMFVVHCKRNVEFLNYNNIILADIMFM